MGREITALSGSHRGILFAAGLKNGTVFLCEPGTGQAVPLVMVPRSPGYRILKLAFSKSGRSLIAVNRARQVWRWDLWRVENALSDDFVLSAESFVRCRSEEGHIIPSLEGAHNPSLAGAENVWANWLAAAPSHSESAWPSASLSIRHYTKVQQETGISTALRTTLVYDCNSKLAMRRFGALLKKHGSIEQGEWYYERPEH